MKMTIAIINRELNQFMHSLSILIYPKCVTADAFVETKLIIKGN